RAIYKGSSSRLRRPAICTSTRAASAIACAGCSHPPRKKWPQRRVLTSAFSSKRRLADDLTELGDNATAALVRQAIDCFQAWKFEAGEELLERALEERHRHEHEPPRSPYFNTCVLVLA